MQLFQKDLNLVITQSHLHFNLALILTPHLQIYGQLSPSAEIYFPGVGVFLFDEI